MISQVDIMMNYIAMEYTKYLIFVTIIEKHFFEWAFSIILWLSLISYRKFFSDRFCNIR